MLQWLYTYVAKHLPQCFIYFLRHMLQVCFIRVLHMFHTYVASVLFECCVFLQWLHTFFLVFNICSKCFNLFWTYVVSVLSRCCKNRSGVACVAVGPICSSHMLQLLGPPACAWVWRGRHGAGTRHRAAWATVQVRDTVHA